MHINTPCKALQMSEIKKKVLPGDTKQIASTDQVIPITINKRKNNVKL